MTALPTGVIIAIAVVVALALIAGVMYTKRRPLQKFYYRQRAEQASRAKDYYRKVAHLKPGYDSDETEKKYLAAGKKMLAYEQRAKDLS